MIRELLLGRVGAVRDTERRWQILHVDWNCGRRGRGHRLAVEIGATLLGRAPLLVSHIESGQLDSLRDAAHLPPRLYLVAGAQVVSAGDVGVHI